MQNRRDWLKKALIASAVLPLGASLGEQLMAAPVSEAERNFLRSGLKSPMKIRLGSNENPYGPSDRAREAISQIVSETNRYPFQTVSEFKTLLAQKEHVTPDHILVGAGSSDLLCAAGAAFGVEEGSILSSYPTFPMLMNYASVYTAYWDKIDLNEKLETDYPLLASRIKDRTRLVYICNPNNPTGTLVDPYTVKTFCDEVSRTVPVFADEAYLEFLEPSRQISMVDLVRQDKNIIVSRTFSKIYGLAGLRIGYLIARPDIAKKIARHHPGIPTNQVGLAAATVSLGDMEFMELSRRKNALARKHLTDYLDRKNFFYGKSHTNFVMFDPKSDGTQIMNKLAEKGIAIRVWDYKSKPWCRVSIGTLEEMKIFTRAFDELEL
ncbi:MAG: histidinol-phosphate transaminase [Cyclobacteriaceae bacterium]